MTIVSQQCTSIYKKNWSASLLHKVLSRFSLESVANIGPLSFIRSWYQERCYGHPLCGQTFFTGNKLGASVTNLGPKWVLRGEGGRA